jgi:hypothetical protein
VDPVSSRSYLSIFLVTLMQLPEVRSTFKLRKCPSKFLDPKGMKNSRIAMEIDSCTVHNELVSWVQWSGPPVGRNVLQLQEVNLLRDLSRDV